MSDNVQFIKQEIERRIEKYGPDFKTPYDAMYQLLTLLDFIDSLPEEPANNGLEEAALKYRWEHPFCDGYTTYSFEAGAEWQKQQMMKEAVEAALLYVLKNLI